MEWEDVEKQSEEDIAYVREDTALGLVEALEFAKVWTNQRIFIQAVKPKIEAALKAMEETNE
jgi:hypothetical protein